MEVSQTFHLLVAEHTELQTEISTHVVDSICKYQWNAKFEKVYLSGTNILATPTTGNVWHSSRFVTRLILLKTTMTIHLKNNKNIAEPS